MLVILLAVFALFFLTWRQLTWLLLVFIPFEGAISLVFWPATAPLLLKDVLLAILYVKFLGEVLSGRSRTSKPHPLLMLLLLMLGYWAAMDILNPGLPTPLMGVIGLRTLVFYVPLIWVAQTFFAGWREIRTFFYVMAAPAILVCAVAAVEVLKGPDWYASLGPGFAAARWGVAGFSGASVFRVNATFAAAGHFGAYLAAMVLLVFSYALTKPRGKTRALCYVTLVALLVGLFANNQRSTSLVLLLGIPVLLMINARRVPAGVVVSTLVVGALGLWLAAATAGAAFADRWMSVAYDPWRVIVVDHLVNLLVPRLTEAIASGPIFGHGTGSATAGARYLAPIWSGSESTVGGVVYELGLPGLFLYALLIGTTIFLTVKAWRQASDQRARILVAGILIYQLGMVAQMGSYAPLQYTPTILLFWFSAGLAQALATLKSSDSQPTVSANWSNPLERRQKSEQGSIASKRRVSDSVLA